MIILFLSYSIRFMISFSRTAPKREIKKCFTGRVVTFGQLREKIARVQLRG
jgi:hypothetical protein